MNRLLLNLLCLLVLAASASAQSYPYPGKETPVLCTGCGGTNEGKPTYAYRAPLVAHAGRYVDSTTTGNVQNMGMRTVRARVTRLARERNRIYIALGETIGAYTLDQFFTTTLRQPIVPVNKIPVNTNTTWSRYGAPFEKALRPESIFYAEALDSGWETYLQDGQRVLSDFDVDERGYVYIGTVNFGWGIAKDTGLSNAHHMPFVAQIADPPLYPAVVLAIRSGSSWYAVISSNTRGDERALLYDVTNPATPKAKMPIRSGAEHGIVSWSKYDAGQRLAIIHNDGHLRIHDYATYVAGGAALADYAPEAGKKFMQAEFDENGNVWVAISGTTGVVNNVLMKIAPVASGYATETFDVYGSAFNATYISAAANRIAVIGTGAGSRELRLFELVGGAPRLLATDNFFRNYYEVVPSGYADPGSLTGGSHVRIVEQGAQTYLMFSAEGLGDVYRLERGTAQIATSLTVSATQGTNVVVTANVIPQSTGAAGPTGVVTFVKDGAPLATAAVLPHDQGWRATLTLSLGANVSTLTATYEGDDLYLPSAAAHIGDEGPLPAATAVNATATGANSAVVTWQAVPGATAYRVYRSPNVSTPFTLLGQVTGTVYTDSTAPANATSLYRVVALDGTREGLSSAIDIATTVVFDDDPVIRLVHLTQLRTAVNAMRAAAALPAATFSDGDAPAVVKGVHVTELRTAADDARAALGLGGVATAPITPQVTFVRRDDFVNLRLAVE